MDASRLEALLEQLIDKRDELISRIERLEATVENQLTEANASISELQSSSSRIYYELVWWGEGHPLAKQVLMTLSNIEYAVGQS